MTQGPSAASLPWTLPSFLLEATGATGHVCAVASPKMRKPGAAQILCVNAEAIFSESGNQPRFWLPGGGRGWLMRGVNLDQSIKHFTPHAAWKWCGFYGRTKIKDNIAER